MNTAECARKINEAMNVLPAGLALEAWADAGEVVVVLTICDEVRAPLDVRESVLPVHLVNAATETSAERFEAFLAASARWLAVQPPSTLEDLYPHDVFVEGALADEERASFSELLVALGAADRLHRRPSPSQLSRASL
jgi:hypothetical protein